ncbi:hypothetical protein OF83DRAFT_1171614 [Amylostereum chailletii]|nr:hypothetical protein OF83DRAFT_1171614 [Amylostereum chailletii]
MESRLKTLLPEGASKELSFQVMNDELSGLFLALLALKQRRNAHAPIHALPPDVLEEIFSIVASQPYTDANGVRRTFAGWISVTHVCRYWRQASSEIVSNISQSPIMSQVALDQASLWTKINCYDSDKAAEMLTRSREAPLTLTIPRWDDRSAQRTTMALVRPHLSHVRELIIKRVDKPKALEPLVDGVPLLESLTLERGHSLVAMPSLICPDTLFASNAPRLTRLSLVKCTLSNIPTQFSNITSLDVVCIPKLEETNILRVLGDAFQAMSSLKHLSITDGYPDLPPPAQEDIAPDPISVPSRLEEIRFNVVESTTLLACMFANRITGPPSLRIELDSRSTTERTSISSLILRRLGPDNPPRVLHVRVTNLNFFTLDAWTSPYSHPLGLPSIIAIRDTRPVALADFLDTFTRAHLSEVTDLRVAFNFAGLTRPQGITPRTCMQRFERASRVKQLTLLPPFASFLQTMIDYQAPQPPAYRSTSGGQGSGSGRVHAEIFPELEVLILAHGDTEMEGDSSVDELSDTLCALLVSFLALRRESYGPLMELHVPHEWLEHNIVEEFAAEVSDIFFI